MATIAIMINRGFRSDNITVNLTDGHMTWCKRNFKKANRALDYIQTLQAAGNKTSAITELAYRELRAME